MNLLFDLFSWFVKVFAFASWDPSSYCAYRNYWILFDWKWLYLVNLKCVEIVLISSMLFGLVVYYQLNYFRVYSVPLENPNTTKIISEYEVSVAIWNRISKKLYAQILRNFIWLRISNSEINFWKNQNCPLKFWQILLKLVFCLDFKHWMSHFPLFFNFVKPPIPPMRSPWKNKKNQKTNKSKNTNYKRRRIQKVFRENPSNVFCWIIFLIFSANN